MTTTAYSRTLSCDSLTRRRSLSLWMRNSAVSPMGRSMGCLSSFGRMRYVRRSVWRVYSDRVPAWYFCAGRPCPRPRLPTSHHPFRHSHRLTRRKGPLEAKKYRAWEFVPRLRFRERRQKSGSESKSESGSLAALLSGVGDFEPMNEEAGNNQDRDGEREQAQDGDEWRDRFGDDRENGHGTVDGQFDRAEML